MIEIINELREIRNKIDLALDFGKSDYMNNAEKEIYWATLKQIDAELYYIICNYEVKE